MAVATQTVRLGLLGLGKISPFHIANLKDAPGAQIAALIDVSTDNLARTVQTYPELKDVPTYSDYQAALASDLDGVIVMTPHALHYQQIRAALEAGKHVLSEKPFVSRPEQARELISLAKERGRILMLSYQNTLLWQYRYTHQQIAAGLLGEILYCSGQITQDWARGASSWRKEAAGEGGFLIDTGSHFVDLLLYLTGMQPEAVVAFSDTVGQPVDIVTGAVIRFNGGRVATLGAGDFVGEISLFEQTPRTATVTAKTPLRFFVLTGKDFRRLLDHHPKVERKVLQALARRVVALSKDLALT